MWAVCSLSVFCEAFTNLAFGFSYILFLHFLHSIIYVRLLELQVKCCFISLIYIYMSTHTHTQTHTHTHIYIYIYIYMFVEERNK